MLSLGQYLNRTIMMATAFHWGVQHIELSGNPLRDLYIHPSWFLDRLEKTAAEAVNHLLLFTHFSHPCPSHVKL